MSYAPMKARKATQACLPCRKRRRRCEGGMPCFGCLENTTVCVFDDQDRPSESFRRVLRQAKQHASKAEQLSQRLEQLTAQLNTIEHRNSNPMRISSNVNSIAQHRCNESQRVPTTQRLVEQWPEIRAMLCKANIPKENIYVFTTAGNPASFPSRSSKYSTDLYEEAEPSIPRKRKHAAMSEAHSASAAHHAPSTMQRIDHLTPSRARALLHSYVHSIHFQLPIVDLDQVKPVFDRLLQEIDPFNSRTNLPRTKLTYSDPSVRGRSMHHAIFYVILALGEVCESMGLKKRPFRHVRFTDENHKSERFVTVQANLDDSSDECQQFSDLESNLDECMAGGTPENVVEEHFNPHKTNAPHRKRDIPGMEFYRRATRIMGSHLDGNDFIHGQTALLAGLYKALLGQLPEAMNWYCTAGRVIQNLILHGKILATSFMAKSAHANENNDTHRTHEEKHQHHRNLILITAWTAIQLERDILEEVQLPQSGLLAYEDILPLPYCVAEASMRHRSTAGACLKQVWPGNIITMYYTAHLTLRQQLERTKRYRHEDTCLNMSLEGLCVALRRSRVALTEWRADLPSELQWSDERTHVNDTLSAKLRTEYYNVMLVVNRPFLDYLLHIKPYLKITNNISAIASDSNGQPRSKAEMYIFEVIRKMPDPEIWNAAACYLESGLQSAQIFNDIPSHLVLPDFYSVTLAQYHNILTLCAAYLESSLKPMLAQKDLASEIERCITFYQEHTLSSTWFSPIWTTLKKLLAVITEAG